MSIPYNNTLPTYALDLPVTGNTVRYRPFSVREQRILVEALTINDRGADIAPSVVEVLKACTFGDVDIEKLPVMDVDFLFIHVREKSVGDTLDLTATCDKCKAQTLFELNLLSYEIVGSIQDKYVSLNEDKLELRLPEFRDVYKTWGKKNVSEKDFEDVLAKSLVAIHTESESIKFKNYSQEEIHEFIDGLSAKQLNAIEEWFEKQVYIKYHEDVACSNCGNSIEIELIGSQCFFV